MVWAATGPFLVPYTLGTLASGAVYICTEDAFPSKRLWQLIEQQHRLRTDVPGELLQRIRFSNHIFIEHAADVVSECWWPQVAPSESASVTCADTMLSSG